MCENKEGNNVSFSDYILDSDYEPITTIDLEDALAKGSYAVTPAMVKAGYDALTYVGWNGFVDGLDCWPDCAEKIYVAMCLAQKKYP